MMTIATQTQEQSGRLRRVLVFSDLLENSATYPWPRIMTESPENFVSRSRSINALPRLDGASVVVFGFGRDHTELRNSLAPEDRVRLTNLWTGYSRPAVREPLQFVSNWVQAGAPNRRVALRAGSVACSRGAASLGHASPSWR